MATHSVLMASVLILKPTWCVLIWFFAFRIVHNHHFKSYKPGSLKRNIFAFLIKKFSTFLKLGSTDFLTVL